MGKLYQAERFTFFYGGPFSQWCPSPMDVGGIEYNCAEQYMMAMKACLFNDRASCIDIMATRDPAKQKALGKRVRNYDDWKWASVAKDVVFRGNYAKFTQNPDLLRALLATRGTTLVEASPTDVRWGIGLSEADPDRFVRERWRGSNWLGQVLTDLRDGLFAVAPGKVKR